MNEGPQKLAKSAKEKNLNEEARGEEKRLNSIFYYICFTFYDILLFRGFADSISDRRVNWIRRLSFVGLWLVFFCRVRKGGWSKDRASLPIP